MEKMGSSTGNQQGTAEATSPGLVQKNPVFVVDPGGHQGQMGHQIQAVNNLLESFSCMTLDRGVKGHRQRTVGKPGLTEDNGYCKFELLSGGVIRNPGTSTRRYRSSIVRVFPPTEHSFPSPFFGRFVRRAPYKSNAVRIPPASSRKVNAKRQRIGGGQQIAHPGYSLVLLPAWNRSRGVRGVLQTG